MAHRPDVIFHLAAVVSGQAEADFAQGYRVNLDGTRALLEAIRAAHTTDGYRPRLVFSSSIAVFGAPLPDVTPEDFAAAPLTSYGTQKAIGELLLADYTRRGFVDGVGIRLPTICIRPGRPNQAASGFFSSILREPLVGQEAILPVPETVRHWFASPRSAVGCCLRAATIDSELIGPRRTLSMPGLSATVGEQIDALRRAAGEQAVRLIRHEPDPTIIEMIDGWAPALDASAGRAARVRCGEVVRRDHPGAPRGRAAPLNPHGDGSLAALDSPHQLLDDQPGRRVLAVAEAARPSHHGSRAPCPATRPARR